MKTLITFAVASIMSVAALACLPPPALTGDRQRLAAVMESYALTETITEMTGHSGGNLQMTTSHKSVWTADGAVKFVTVKLEGEGKSCEAVFLVTDKKFEGPANPWNGACPGYLGVESVVRQSFVCN